MPKGISKTSQDMILEFLRKSESFYFSEKNNFNEEDHALEVGFPEHYLEDGFILEMNRVVKEYTTISPLPQMIGVNDAPLKMWSW